MPRATFTDADFLAAACALAAKRGPAAVTVESVTARLKAPTGSFYYRFASRDVLLGELWLATARAFQEGFIAAIATGDGLAAALHTPIWVRAHLNEARVFLLHHRDDFVQGAWPAVLRRGVAELHGASMIVSLASPAIVSAAQGRRRSAAPASSSPTCRLLLCGRICDAARSLRRTSTR